MNSEQTFSRGTFSSAVALMVLALIASMAIVFSISTEKDLSLQENNVFFHTQQTWVNSWYLMDRATALALVDSVSVNCSVPSTDDLNTSINTRFQQISDHIEANAGVSCVVSNLRNFSLDSSRYTFDFDLLCSRKTGDLESKISKTVSFSKEFSVSGTSDKCNVWVKDVPSNWCDFGACEGSSGRTLLG